MCDFSYPPLHIPFKVWECSDYVDRRLPDVEDMEEIALDLTWVKPSRPAGFRKHSNGKNGSPEQNPQEEQDEDDEAA